MDVSLLVSLALGLPAAVLATLRIIDWQRKRKARQPKTPTGEQERSADQELALLVRRAEMAVDVEREITEELRQYEAIHRR